MRIQTSGSFDKITGIYSISISTDENRLITLDGLSRDDMLELHSCIDCTLFEETFDGKTGTTI